MTHCESVLGKAVTLRPGFVLLLTAEHSPRVIRRERSLPPRNLLCACSDVSGADLGGLWPGSRVWAVGLCVCPSADATRF